VWSLGCVVAFYMKIGKHVFNCNDNVLNYNSEEATGTIFDQESKSSYSQDLIQLVKTMIQKEPSKRPIAKEVSAMCTDERCETGQH